MAKKAQFNPVKKAIVKSSLLKGKSARQALKDAGYSNASVSHSTHCAVVKHSTAEILAEFRMCDVTPERVLADLEHLQKLALEKGDIPTATKITELRGKYLAMWTDKKVIDHTILTKEEQGILSKYCDTNRLTPSSN